jgi:opacity protein-like surface antigen
MKKVAVVALLCAAPVPVVCAQPGQGATWQSGRLSVGVSAGVLMPGDTAQTVSGTALGLPVAARGTMSYKPGAIIDALAGYQFNDLVGGELTVSWARYDYDAIRGTLTAGPMTLHGGQVEGHVRYWMGFANAIVTPWGRARFSPYVGGGIGITDYVADLKSVDTGVLGRVALDSRTGHRDLAANAIAGFTYAVSPAVSLGARYRYLWTNSARTITSGGLTGHSSNATHHILSVTTSYRF